MDRLPFVLFWLAVGGVVAVVFGVAVAAAGYPPGAWLAYAGGGCAVTAGAAGLLRAVIVSALRAWDRERGP